MAFEKKKLRLSDELRARLAERMRNNPKMREERESGRSVAAVKAYYEKKRQDEHRLLEDSLTRDTPLLQADDQADVRRTLGSGTEQWKMIHPTAQSKAKYRGLRYNLEKYIKRTQEVMIREWRKVAATPLPTLRMFLLGLRLDDLERGTGIDKAVLVRYFRGSRILSMSDGMRLSIFLGRSPIEVCAFFNAQRLGYLKNGMKPKPLPKIGRRYSPERLKCLRPGHVHGEDCYMGPTPRTALPANGNRARTARANYLSNKLKRLQEKLKVTEMRLKGLTKEEAEALRHRPNIPPKTRQW